MKAWGFTDGNYRVPDDETLKSLLQLADPSLIEYDSSTADVNFEEKGVQIDFGGIAKGYTSSRIMDIYKEKGVTSGLVNLGGNAQVLGQNRTAACGVWPFRVRMRKMNTWGFWKQKTKQSSLPVVMSVILKKMV